MDRSHVLLTIIIIIIIIINIDISGQVLRKTA